MPSLSNVLKLLAIGGALKEIPSKKRIFSGIAVVVALTVVTAMMVGALLVGLLYALYASLVAYAAFTPLASAGIVAALAIAITASLVAITLNYVKNLLSLQHQISEAANEIPVVSNVKKVANSFVDGFMLKNEPKPRKKRAA